MNEQALLLAGVVFIAFLAAPMIWFGAANGGVAWSAGWICLFLSGVCVVLAETWPALRAGYPILGTAFPTLIWIGTRQFAGRSVPRSVLLAASLAALLRVGLQPFVSEAATQATGASLVSLGAFAAAYEMQRLSRSPRGGTPDTLLALTMPLIAATACLYAWYRVSGNEANGMFLWLLTGILIAGLQANSVVGRIGRAAERGRATLAALFDSVPIGLVLSDASGRIKLTNPTMAKMVGDEPADAWKTRSVDDLLTHLGGAGTDHTQRASHRLDDLRGDVCEEELQLPDDRVIETHGRTVLAEDGAIVGRLILARDVTIERQLQEKAQRTGRLETLGRLAGGIAHDFNNKLTTVIGNAALVRSSLPSGHPQHASLADLESAANECADLTRDLLDFAKRGPRSARPLELEPFLNELIDGLEFRLGSDVTLDIQVHPDVGTIRADPAQLERVITNLLLNARDAVAHGGWIHLAATRVQRAELEQIEIAISDDGIGMDEGTRQRIFDPYFSIKASGTAATGLGLAIVHGIVTSHDGEIHVESCPGQGTKVITTWPTAEVNSGDGVYN
ncbi:MAG: PAS domain-containing protein [bacterium]|nr:PAS domain-containing protein [bacterium]